jgi:transcriptional regulator with XRE-family HTH domain
MEWWERVSARRKNLGMTGRDLGDAVGVSPQRISDVEAGRYRNPELLTLTRMADALHTTVSFLLDGIDRDLLRHSEAISSALGSAVPHLEGTDRAGQPTSSRTPVDILPEIADAVVGFAELAERASEWSNRLADLVTASQLGLDVTHAQVTVARVTTSHSGPDVREDGGQSHRQDRPRSA